MKPENMRCKNCKHYRKGCCDMIAYESAFDSFSPGNMPHIRIMYGADDELGLFCWARVDPDFGCILFVEA